MSRALLKRSSAGVLRTGKLFAHPISLAVTAVCVAALALAAGAQTAPSGTAGQVQFVSPQAFRAMVAAGTVSPVTPLSLLQQQVATIEANLLNRAIVDDYLRQHPELTDLDRLLKATPDFDRRRGNGETLRPALGGGYAFTFTNKSGAPQTVEMMGQDNKVLLLAHSIQQLQLPAAQLQLYTTLYNQLPASYCQPVGIGANSAPSPVNCTDLPTPASLQSSPLGDISQALATLTSHTSAILSRIPIPLALEPIGCAADIGNNNSAAANVTWGDQAVSQGCPAPAAGGIYANFNFANKGLVSCIKNQGDRGTCHIFAATSAIEELVARDTGTFVNLSEQDFQEHLKMAWEAHAPDLVNDSGSSWQDLTDAAQNNYRFAYENQWDYNPSLSKPFAETDINSCGGYPGSEAGCSDTAPQAPVVCASDDSIYQFALPCGFALATLSGVRSPYSAVGVSDVWNAANPNLTFAYMVLGLAFNDAVVLGFNSTDDFQGAPGGYIPYDASDLSTSVGVHMVHVAGYVSNEDLAANVPTAPPGAGGGYFIIKNSWGACNGDAGYYYMPVSYLLSQATEVDIVSTVGH